MRDLQQELIEKVVEIGKKVAELPETIQPLAFQFLLDQHRMQQPVSDATAPRMVPSAEQTEEGWAELLASKAGVTVERIRQLFDFDEEGFWLTHPEIGESAADRLRSMSILILWANRVVQRELYVPQSELYRAARRLGLDTHNITNVISRTKQIKAANVRGEKMVQLVSNWEEEARARVEELTA